jgi:AraC-like DNA-binding protein
LYVRDVDPLTETCRVTAWRPAVPGISEVFHARIVGYRYPPHMHDTWTLLIVDDGAIRYDMEKRHHGAVRSTVTILPPGVTHDGRPADGGGHFRKRNLYLDAGFLPAGFVGRAVDAPAFTDGALRAAVSTLHDRLVTPDPLDVEARLALIAERFHRHLARRPPVPPDPEPAVADRLRDYLDDHATEPLTLGDAARLLDRSVPHLIRSFRRRYQISPYAYVVGARVETARKLLLEGLPPAQVATLAGFYDQAHLTRHFKRHVSVPPASYAAGFRLPGP